VFTCLLLFPIFAIIIGCLFDAIELFVLTPVFREAGSTLSLWRSLDCSEVAFVYAYWVIDVIVVALMAWFFTQAMRLRQGSAPLIVEHLHEVEDMPQELAEPRVRKK